jgi:hypothetical protein
MLGGVAQRTMSEDVVLDQKGVAVKNAIAVAIPVTENFE